MNCQINELLEHVEREPTIHHLLTHAIKVPYESFVLYNENNQI